MIIRGFRTMFYLIQNTIYDFQQIQHLKIHVIDKQQKDSKEFDYRCVVLAFSGQTLPVY